MGFFRFLLSLLVVVSHMGITFQGLNPGVSAVVVFYLLAGQVVCRLWLKQSHLPAARRLQWFYRDRGWRILPMYYFVLMTGVCAWLSGAESYFLSGTPDIGAWLYNLLIVPLNYYMFNQADTFTLLPPAWSLAVEIQFYLLVPLLMATRTGFYFALAASVAVFALAQAAVLNTDVFGYRLLAGVGFVFLCGAMMANTGVSRSNRYLVRALWLAMALYGVYLLNHPDLWRPFNREVALGFVIGVPAVAALSRWRMSGWLHRSQRLAGALSYGVFLAHFPAIWLFERFLPAMASNVIAVTLLSTAIALAGHLFIEKPLWQRHRAMLGNMK